MAKLSALLCLAGLAGASAFVPARSPVTYDGCYYPPRSPPSVASSLVEPALLLLLRVCWFE